MLNRGPPVSNRNRVHSHSYRWNAHVRLIWVMISIIRKTVLGKNVQFASNTIPTMTKCLAFVSRRGGCDKRPCQNQDCCDLSIRYILRACLSETVPHYFFSCVSTAIFLESFHVLELSRTGVANQDIYASWTEMTRVPFENYWLYCRVEPNSICHLEPSVIAALSTRNITATSSHRVVSFLGRIFARLSLSSWQ